MRKYSLSINSTEKVGCPLKVKKKKKKKKKGASATDLIPLTKINSENKMET